MVRLVILLVASASLFGADSPLLFRKVLGGTGTDTVTGLTTDPNGYAIVVGNTTSYDFPVTDGSRNVSTHFAESSDSAVTWRPLGSLPAGTPRSLAVSSGTWYAAGKAGIFKSTDGGATWRTSMALADCNPFDPSCGGDSLQLSRQAGTLYAIANSNIVKSIDFGATWNPVNPPTSDVRPVGYIRIDPFHPGHLFTAGFRGVYRSLDDGADWTPYTTPAINSLNCGTSPPAFDQARENLVYVIDHCAVYRSNDAGLNWNTVDTPFRNPLNVDTTAGGAIYVRDIAGLWVSNDAGITWSLVLAADPAQNPPIFLGADPTRPDVIIVSNQRSDDGGATWHPLTLGRQVNALVFDPANPGRAVAATDGAAAGFVAKLGYGGDIMAATYVNTPGSTSIAGVATDPAGNIYIAGGRGDQSYFAAEFDGGLNALYSVVLPSYVYVNGIAVDATGAAVILGSGLQQPNAQWRCLVTKLAPDATVAFATMFGDNSGGCTSIAVDPSGNSLIAHVLVHRSVLTKLDAAGNIVFTQPIDSVNSGNNVVAADSAGNIFVSGTTHSQDFQTTPDAYQTKVNSNCAYPSSAVVTGIIGTITTHDNSDTFVQKLDSNGSVIFSTLLGAGCLDFVTSIAVGGGGNVWLAGRTNSSPFPQVNSFESGPAYSFYKGFVSELDTNGAVLKLSSYITAGDQPQIAVDSFGNTYVAGSTTPPLPYSSGPCCAAPPKDVHVSVDKLESTLPAPLAITSAGNAFTLRNGPVSAGQITLITVDGLLPEAPQDFTLTPSAPLPRAISGVQVLFDGEAAPLVSVAAGRVVAVAPYNLAGKRQTGIQVAVNGVVSAPVLGDVLADLAFLSRDGSGTGQAVAINPDGSQNSPENPAPQNAMVTVFVTGNGVVPACPEGSVDPGSGYVCGIFKTQIRTPNFAVSTAALPNSTVTVAVK